MGWSAEAQAAFVDARSQAFADLFGMFIAERRLDHDTRTWPTSDRVDFLRLQQNQVEEWNVLAFADDPPTVLPTLPTVAR